MTDANETGRPGPGAGPPGFEEALERLEGIVEELEGGSLTLEESIAHYEEGIGLARRLTRSLDEAEKRIERLVESDAEGAPPTTRAMDLEPEANDDEPDPPPASSAPRPAAEPGPARRPPAPRPGGRGSAPDPEELPF